MRFKKLLFVFMFVIRLTAVELLDALSDTHDLELGYVKGSTSSDPFSQFYSDISAVSSILNSLSLEMELHDRSVSVVEVLIELTKSGIPLDLMNKLKRGNFKDLESKVQDLASKMSSLNGVGAWNTVKIRHGLDIVEELKGNVSGAAGNLNSQKIEEMLGVIEKVRQANYTLLDSDPIGDMKQVLEYISSKDSISDADAEEFSKQMFALKKLLPIVEETAKLFVSGESLFNELYTVTEVDANKKSFDPLFEISDILKDNFTDSGALTALSTEFSSFESVQSKLSSLEDPISKVSVGLVDVKELVLSIFSTPVVLNKTSGFVNRLEDLDSVFTDLKLKRMESLIGGGKSLKMLEGHIQWINSLKEKFRNVETIWKSIHKNRDSYSKDFTRLSDLEEKIKSFNSDLGSISTEISDLNDFLKSPDAVFQLSKTGKLEGFQSKIGTFLADIEKANKIFNSLSVAQSHIAVLSNLTSLKSIFSVEKLDSVKLAELKKQNLTSVLAALTPLKKLLSNNEKLQFSQLQKDGIALFNQAKDVRIMKEWANGVKNFKRPQSLFQSLTTTQTVLAEVSATKKSISSIQEAVSETGKSVEAVKAMESSPKSEISESTWKELIPLSKTIGDTAQCASMLSSKNGIVEKMGKLKKAGEELDATLKTSKDQKAFDEIRTFWKGYSSLDSEIKTILNQVEKFQKNVPSTEDVNSLETYAPVIRAMEDVHFQTTNIQDVVASIQQFKVTISDSVLAETVSKLRAELVQCPVLEYSQYSRSLKLAPDALHSVMIFFSNLFDFSLETIHSTTIRPDSDLPFFLSVLALVTPVLVGACILAFLPETTSKDLRQPNFKPFADLDRDALLMCVVVFKNEKKNIEKSRHEIVGRDGKLLVKFFKIELGEQSNVRGDAKKVVLATGEEQKPVYMVRGLRCRHIAEFDVYYDFSFDNDSLRDFVHILYFKGMVVVVGVDTLANISSGGANRYWPDVQGETKEIGEYSVSLVNEEEMTDGIYCARIQVFETANPAKKTTVFLNIFTKEWHGNLIPVADAVNFYKKFHPAMALTCGNFLYYGPRPKQAIFIAIVESVYAAVKSARSPKEIVDCVAKYNPESFTTDGEYMLVVLATAELASQMLARLNKTVTKSAKLLQLETDYANMLLQAQNGAMLATARD